MSEPRWLDERESGAWRGYREMSMLLNAQIACDLARDTGLSDADYTVLVALSEAPRYRMRLVDLAEQTLWSKSRLSHQLSRMERRGQVRREALPGKGRATDAVLTERGLRVIERAAPQHLESVRRHFIDHLTEEEMRVLANATSRVLGHLHSIRDEGAS